MKKLPSVIRTIGLLLFWLVMLFLSHLAGFDLFGDDSWYFYALACAFFLAQLLPITAFAREGRLWPLAIFAAAYLLVLVFYDLHALSYMIRYADPSPKGLVLLGLALDLIGAAVCVLARGKAKACAPRG